MRSPKDISFTFALRGEEIDRASEHIYDYLMALSLDRREAQRVRLSAENALLVWQERLGQNVSVSLSCYVRLGQPLLRLRLAGTPCDPLERSEDDLSIWSKNLLARMETRAEYAYARGVNTITFRVVTHKRSPLMLLLYSLAAAVAVGLLGSSFLPVGFRAAVAQDWLDPIAATYLNVLGFCGIPLIFLSVALGIKGIDDVKMFGRIGKYMVSHFMLILLVAVLVTGVLAFPLYTYQTGGNALQVTYTQLLEMVLGWLPTNLVAPFMNANAMQLVFMGAIFGVGLLKLDPVAEHLSKTLEDLNNLLLMAAEWFTRLLPAFVFIIIVKSFWMGQLSEILPAWRSLVFTTAMQAAVLLAMGLFLSIKEKVALSALMKKISNTFLIALGTNSCTASIPANYACCGDRLGINHKVFVFGIPVGTSVFKPATAVRLIALLCYMASTYQVEVSLNWFAAAAFMSVMFSIAVPAIPGGTLMLCPMLFAQLGIPEEALAPMLATDIFFDAICTAFNQVSVQLALALQARKLGLLNGEVLRS